MRKLAYLRLIRRKLHKYFDVRRVLRRLLSLNDSAHHIALSFGIGVLIGFVPVLGVQTVLSLTGAWLFRLNAVAVVTGSLVTNPLTFLPLYGLSFQVGAWVFPQSGEVKSFPLESDMSLEQVLAFVKPHLVEFLLGCAIVGSVLGVISYFLLRSFIIRYRSGNNGKSK